MKPTRCTLALKYTKSAPLEGGESKGGEGSSRALTTAHPMFEGACEYDVCNVCPNWCWQIVHSIVLAIQ